MGQLYDELYSWQKNIVDKFKDKRSFGLFLDMGLGKTPISLAFAEYHKCQKVMIVTVNAKATESVKVNDSWFGWVKRSDMKDYDLITKWSKMSDIKPDRNQVFLINYESLFSRKHDRSSKIELKDNVLAFVNSCKGKDAALIVDESHKLKVLSSLQTQSVIRIQKWMKLTAKSTWTYLLTGTPFTTGFIDLYTQLKVLGCGMTKGEFVDEFCVRGNQPGLLGWQQPIVGYKNIDELYSLVHRYALTIKSDEVADLPEQIFIHHEYPMTDSFNTFTKDKMKVSELRPKIDILLKEKKVSVDDLNGELFSSKDKLVNNPFYRDIAYPDLSWFADTSGTFWLRSRQLSIGFQGNTAKDKWFDDTRLKMIEQFLADNEDNYVIFYNYNAELIELYQICEKLGYKIDVYCGEIKSLVFYDKYKAESEEKKLVDKKNVILANFASGSTGLNLQEYNKCIIFSLPLYRDWAQGLKRIHRIGQKNTVFYHLFIQKNFLDDGMVKALEEKTQYSEDLFMRDLARVNGLVGKEQNK